MRILPLPKIKGAKITKRIFEKYQIFMICKVALVIVLSGLLLYYRILPACSHVSLLLM